VVGEWLIDLLYWRKKRVKWAEKETGLRAEAETAKAETQVVRAEMVTAQAEVEAVRSELAVSEERALTLAMAAEPRDDLTVIEGIGPKIADLLDGHAVRTFTVLAETSVERLHAILDEGGPRYRLSDPTSWPRQARLAANRDWERLQQVKQQLRGGVRKPPEPKPVPKDDLTIIEGIGAKIAELLNQHGITTFAQLAAATEEQLRAILQEAGPAFRMADPHTWPQQAQLAADRDWVRLQAVNQRLTGGVRRRAPAAPAEPAPVEPAPVEPAPVEPAPVELMPVDVAPVEPANVEPANVEPANVEPAPAGPMTVELAPVEPGPENA
jgi:predicted flap endonuclease-1-like 5' DNA nuclease